MEFVGQKIQLPLDPTINRCLAHGDKKGEWCERRQSCACHQTIKYDIFGRTIPAAYRKCSTELFAAYIPIDGFSPEAE